MIYELLNSNLSTEVRTKYNMSDRICIGNTGSCNFVYKCFFIPIAREKSCDYSLIIFMKKCEMVKKKKRKLSHNQGKLPHPGRALDLKPKDLIGPDQILLFSNQPDARIECVRSCDKKPYLHNETKGGICIKIEFNPQNNIHSSKMAVVS